MAVALFNRHKALSQPQAPNRCFTASRINQCQQEQKQLRALLDASAHAAMALVYSLASGLMLRRDAETFSAKSNANALSHTEDAVQALVKRHRVHYMPSREFIAEVTKLQTLH